MKIDKELEFSTSDDNSPSGLISNSFREYFVGQALLTFKDHRHETHASRAKEAIELADEIIKQLK